MYFNKRRFILTSLQAWVPIRHQISDLQIQKGNTYGMANLSVSPTFLAWGTVKAASWSNGCLFNSSMNKSKCRMQGSEIGGFFLSTHSDFHCFFMPYTLHDWKCCKISLSISPSQGKWHAKHLKLLSRWKIINQLVSYHFQRAFSFQLFLQYIEQGPVRTWQASCHS